MTRFASSATLLLAGAGDLARRTGLLFRDTGNDVIALRRHPPPSLDAFTVIQADLTRPDTLGGLPGAISHVLYAATPDERSEAAYHRTFVQGSQNLVNALDTSQLTRFLFVSSTAVYGGSAGWVDETTPEAPEKFNGRVLLEAEQRLRERLGDKLVVLRPSGLYGPGRTQLLERLRAGQVRVRAAPVQWTNRLHIDDAAGACRHLLTLTRPDPVYLGTDNTPLPMTVLYDALADMLGVSRPLRGDVAMPVASKRLSNARLRASGFTPAWPNALKGYRSLIGSNVTV